MKFKDNFSFLKFLKSKDKFLSVQVKMSKEISHHYNIIPLKVINHSPYNVCISVSLFKMRYAYKSFGKYVTKFLSWVNKLDKSFFVRLYTDKITYEDEDFSKILKKNIPHLEIYSYEYPEFQDELGYHLGTFGSIMRYLPFFDKQLREEMDYIWTSDVDVFAHHFKQHIESMKSKKADINYYSKACYYRPWIPDSVDYPIINLRLIISKKVNFSKVKFDNYLKNVLKGKYKPLEELIRKFNSDSESHPINPLDKTFIYGFDEVYTNQILYNEILHYKRLIDYNVELKPFENYETIPHTKELNELRYDLWKNSKVNKSLIFKLKKLNDEVHKYLSKELLEEFKIFIPRMDQCYKDYKKYGHKLDLTSTEYTSQIIVKAKKD